MSRYSTLFPVNSLHVSDTFLAESWLSQDDVRPHDTVTVPEVAYAVNFIDLLMMDTCPKHVEN
jgi:hypothetical protein